MKDKYLTAKFARKLESVVMDSIWIFDGVGSQFPNGVFTTRELAEAWIIKHRLTGTLTQYPIDVGVYEWAIENGISNLNRIKSIRQNLSGAFPQLLRNIFITRMVCA